MRNFVHLSPLVKYWQVSTADKTWLNSQLVYCALDKGRKTVTMRPIWQMYHPTIDWSSMPMTLILSCLPATSRCAPPNLTTLSSGLQSITFGKCTEIIFVDPRRGCSAELPPLLARVKHVTTMKILVVTVTNSLSVAEHVQAINRVCAPSIHAPPPPRPKWRRAAVQTAYRAIIVSRLTYVTSTWWGFTTSDDTGVSKDFLGMESGLALLNRLAHCRKPSRRCWRWFFQSCPT